MQNSKPSGGIHVSLRTCTGGTNDGALCKNNAECDSNVCEPYNKIEFTVNLKALDDAGNEIGYTPTAAEIAYIESHFQDWSDALFDATDGQMYLNVVNFVEDNNAPNAAMQLTVGKCRANGGACWEHAACTGADKCDTATGACMANSGTACATDADCTGGDACAMGGGSAHVRGWDWGGQIFMHPFCLSKSSCFSHEFMHYAADALDEYAGFMSGLGAPFNDMDGDGSIDECGDRFERNRCYGGTDDGHFCEDSTDCGGGGVCQRIRCDARGVLMECCGMTNNADMCVPSFHDGDGDTAHSHCRNRSTWEQLCLEWPDVIECPAAGALPQVGPFTAPEAIVFNNISAIDRFVAVIDRSDSMSSDTPARIDIAVNTLQDFVGMMSFGSEFGLTSFASADGGNPAGVDSTKDFPAVGTGLFTINSDADKVTAQTAVAALTSRVGGMTRIGAGLREGISALYENSGEVTLNTSMMLLTDGINNRPDGSSHADLDDACQTVADSNISFLVTCIGEARDSHQCSAIADKTNGRYVDSVDAPNMYDAFVDFLAEAEGNGVSGGAIATPIASGEISDVFSVIIEEGAGDARFIGSWRDPASDMDLYLMDPNGTILSAVNLGVQGEYYRVANPVAGEWQMVMYASTAVADEAFSVRALVSNDQVNVASSLKNHNIFWSESQGFEISALPVDGLPVTGCEVVAEVTMPDGSVEEYPLEEVEDCHDGGRYKGTFRDLVAGDGTYSFVTRTVCDAATSSRVLATEDGFELPNMSEQINSFSREVRYAGYISGVPDNLPPIADICADGQAECTGELTTVELDGSCSYDPENSVLDYSWSSDKGIFANPNDVMPEGDFPLGLSSVTLVVEDAEGNQSEAVSGWVNIQDTTPPVFADTDATIEAFACGDAVDYTFEVPEATDVCAPPTVTGQIVSFNGEALSTPIAIEGAAIALEPGIYNIKWIATDGSGNTAELDQSLLVKAGIRVNSSMDIRDRAGVYHTNGEPAAIYNSGSGQVEVGANSESGSIFSVGNVFLRSNASVTGSIFTGGTVTQQNGVTVANPGTIYENYSVIFNDVTNDSLSGVVFTPPAEMWLNFNPDGMQHPLAPGSYGYTSINSGATVVLSAGDYYFKSFTINSTSTVIVDDSDGPVRIFVQEYLAFREPFETPVGALASVYVAYTGTNDVMFENAPFNGVIIAPNATVKLGQNDPLEFRGRFYAKKLEVAVGSSLVCDADVASEF